MLKKKTIKDAEYNPLQANRKVVDTFLSTSGDQFESDIESPVEAVTEPQKPVIGASRKTPKSNISINIEAAVADKIRDYLFTVARRDETICSIATEALQQWIDKWEKKNGPIPQREGGTLRGGRPPKI